MTPPPSTDLFTARTAPAPEPRERRGLTDTILDALGIPAHCRVGARAWRVRWERTDCPVCRGSGFKPFSYPSTSAPAERCDDCAWGWVMRPVPRSAEEVAIRELLVSIRANGPSLRLVWEDEVTTVAAEAFPTRQAAALAPHQPALASNPPRGRLA